MRIGIVKGMDSLGLVVGNILGGKLYKEYTSFYLNHGISIATSIVCVLYILCFVPESVEIDHEQKKKRYLCLTDVKQIFSTCFKDRPERTEVILLIIDFAILAFVTNTSNYDFLLVRKR